MTQAKFCRHCGSALGAGARFCTECGGRVAGDATGAAETPGTGAAPGRGQLAMLAPWLVLGATLMALLGYAIGSQGMGATAPTGSVASAASDGGIVLAPDISTLSPEERVDRLFNRVMTLAAAGQEDSVQFFAPMAINAMAALLPLDAHRRYDLGLIQLTAGDAAAAQAQADSILVGNPSHLLGLALAMRASLAQGRPADAARAAETLRRVATAERATGALEYTEHARDVVAALEEAERLRAAGARAKQD